MKPEKIRLERGDTLGGTVPLLLRDRVTADFKSGAIHRRRKVNMFSSSRDRAGSHIGFSLLLLLLTFLIAGFVYGIVFEPVLLVEWTGAIWDSISAWMDNEF